jgi:hypothetical protein
MFTRQFLQFVLATSLRWRVRRTLDKNPSGAAGEEPLSGNRSRRTLVKNRLKNLVFKVARDLLRSRSYVVEPTADVS